MNRSNRYRASALTGRGFTPAAPRQAGAALIMVLLIMAVVAGLAVSVTETLRFSISRMNQQQSAEQLYWYAQGAEQMALAALRQDAAEATTHLQQDWASDEAVFPVRDGVLRGKVSDLHSCFNLNALAEGSLQDQQGQSVKPDAMQRLSTLMELLKLDVSVQDSLPERIRDWVDQDQQPTGFQGREQGFQTAQSGQNGQGYSYAAPNGPMLDLSELWLAQDASAKALAPLLPYLCVRPDKKLALNLNTLTAENYILLQALLPQLDAQGAQTLLADRPEAGFASLEDVWALPVLKGKTLSAQDKARFTLKSSYFRADISVQYQSLNRLFHAWIRADQQQVLVYARQYGEQL